VESTSKPEAAPEPKEWNFHVRVSLHDGSVAAGLKCELRVGDEEKPIEGTTNDRGELKLTVPHAEKEAILKVLHADGKFSLAALKLKPGAD